MNKEINRENTKRLAIELMNEAEHKRKIEHKRKLVEVVAPDKQLTYLKRERKRLLSKLTEQQQILKYQEGQQVDLDMHIHSLYEKIAMLELELHQAKDRWYKKLYHWLWLKVHP